MGKLVGNRYASSLFEVGLELEKTDQFYKELESLKGILESEKDFVNVLEHPRIRGVEKKEIINNVFGKIYSKEVLNLLQIVVDKRRESDLFDIIEEYDSIYNNYNKKLSVTAVTTVPMNEVSMEKLTKVLEEKTGTKITLKNEIDKSILGGIMLKTKERVIDGTVLSELRNMEAAFKKASI